VPWMTWFLPQVRIGFEKLSLDGRKRMDFVGGNYALPFKDCVELIYVEILQGFHFAGRPADFQAADFGGFAKPKMNALVALREKTAAAVNLVGLRHSTRR